MNYLAVLVGGVVILLLVMFGITRYLGPDDLAGCGERPDGNPCQQADAIIAISGGDTTARTAEAIKLYQNGWAPLLIFSGAALDENSPSNAEAMRLQAIEAGVPPEDIAVDEDARDTFENARETSRLTTQLGIERIILVTSAYHQRRANIEFSQAFAGTTVVNHPVATDSQWSSTWWLTPRGWWLAGSELVKISIITFRGDYGE